jgi:hypothetical protein
MVNIKIKHILTNVTQGNTLVKLKLNSHLSRLN